MKTTGLIFDMDGTLWDSSREVAASWAEVLARHPEAGRTVTQADVMGIMGLTMTGIADRLFPQLDRAGRDRLLQECTDYENEYLRIHGGKLYPGLEETLERLHREWPLFIVSNCQKGYIETFLDHYGYWRFFQDIECFGNTGLPKDGSLRLVAERNGLSGFYYLGDIQGDYEATKAAGGHFIHAAYGFGQIEDPVPRVLSLTELPALLATLEKR